MATARFTCPECEAHLKFAKALEVGKKIKCPRCSESIRVPDDDDADAHAIEEKPGRAAVARSKVAASKNGSGKITTKPARKAASLLDGLDDGDDREERRRPSKKSKKKDEPKGMSKGLIFGLIGGGVAVLLIAVVGVVIAITATGGKGKGSSAADEGSTPVAGGPGGGRRPGVLPPTSSPSSSSEGSGGVTTAVSNLSPLAYLPPDHQGFFGANFTKLAELGVPLEGKAAGGNANGPNMKQDPPNDFEQGIKAAGLELKDFDQVVTSFKLPDGGSSAIRANSEASILDRDGSRKPSIQLYSYKGGGAGGGPPVGMGGGMGGMGMGGMGMGGGAGGMGMGGNRGGALGQVGGLGAIGAGGAGGQLGAYGGQLGGLQYGGVGLQYGGGQLGGGLQTGTLPGTQLGAPPGTLGGALGGQLGGPPSAGGAQGRLPGSDFGLPPGIGFGPGGPGFPSFDRAAADLTVEPVLVMHCTKSIDSAKLTGALKGCTPAKLGDKTYYKHTYSKQPKGTTDTEFLFFPATDMLVVGANMSEEQFKSIVGSDGVQSKLLPEVLPSVQVLSKNTLWATIVPSDAAAKLFGQAVKAGSQGASGGVNAPGTPPTPPPTVNPGQPGVPPIGPRQPPNLPGIPPGQGSNPPTGQQPPPALMPKFETKNLEKLRGLEFFMNVEAEEIRTKLSLAFPESQVAFGAKQEIEQFRSILALLVMFVQDKTGKDVADAIMNSVTVNSSGSWVDVSFRMPTSAVQTALNAGKGSGSGSTTTPVGNNPGGGPAGPGGRGGKFGGRGPAGGGGGDASPPPPAPSSGSGQTPPTPAPGTGPGQGPGGAGPGAGGKRGGGGGAGGVLPTNPNPGSGAPNPTTPPKPAGT